MASKSATAPPRGAGAVEPDSEGPIADPCSSRIASPGSVARGGPLAGVRVLDVTHVMAGAWCAQLLVQMGADVVKIERPHPGEDLRRAQQQSGNAVRPFDAVNHGKRSLAVDLTEPAGVEVVRRLAEGSDVLVQNYRPGTMERRGLGYEALAESNPGLVYASISAFGATGPYRDRAGLDLIAQAMAGILSVTGEPGRPPVAAGVPVADLTAGTLAALGILAAWIERLRTGRGQAVETSLFEAALSLTVWESATFFDTGSIPRPHGSRHRLASPYGIFAASDGRLVVAAATQRLFERLCGALEREDLAKTERFADPIRRVVHREELERELDLVFGRAPRDSWLTVLEDAGVPCAPVLDIGEVWADPQTAARHMLAEGRSGSRPLKAIGPAVKLSATPWRARPESFALGAHTRGVLNEAGFPEEEIERLLAAGVIEVSDGETTRDD